MTGIPSAQDDAYYEIVRLLTQVARRSDPDGQRRDFAGFLALVVASTAANVGGPDRLLADRSGSWEACHLDGLLRGTMGDQPDDWTRLRTEPLAVPLNVAELVEDGVQHPGLLGLDDAMAVIEARYLDTEDEALLEQCDSEVGAVITRYAGAYRDYGERFDRAVREAASALHLPVAVTVKVDHNPQSEWWAGEAVRNPWLYGDDWLAHQLWSEAHDTVALPNVDVRRELSRAAATDDPAGLPELGSS